jgi:transcriptional regulator of heat shock response
MRILPSDEHQARKEKMLQAVVNLYIKTGKPVGSSTIVDNYHFALSPATIQIKKG